MGESVAAVATGLRYVLLKPRDQLDRLDQRQRPNFVIAVWR